MSRLDDVGELVAKLHGGTHAAHTNVVSLSLPLSLSLSLSLCCVGRVRERRVGGRCESNRQNVGLRLHIKKKNILACVAIML